MNQLKIVELNHTNFSVNPDGLLTISGKAPIFVFFKKSPKDCKHCAHLLPEFVELSKESPIQLGVCTLEGENLRIASMSKASKTPITNVPFLIFFNGGVSYSRYKDPKKSLSSMRTFLQDMMRRIGGQAVPTRPPMNMPQIQIPAKLANNPEYKNLGLDLGSSTNELQQPAGSVPHNTPWDSYKNLDFSYT